MNDNLDKLFRQALENEKVTPPEKVWSNVNKTFIKKRIIPVRWLYPVAASLLLALGIAIFKFDKVDAPDYYQVSSVANLQSPELEKVVEDKAYRYDTTQVVSDFANLHKIKAEKLVASNTSIMVDRRELPVCLLNSNFATAEIPADEVQLSKTERRELIPLVNSFAVKNQEAYTRLLNEHLEKPKQKNKVKITLSGHVNPSFSSGIYSSNARNGRGINYSDGHMTGVMNLGGGLRVAVSTNKRFSFQTGVFYSTMGQKYVDDSDDLSVAAYYLTNDKNFSCRTPLGNIRKRKSSKKSDIQLYESLALDGSAYLPEKLEHVLGTVEIPLQVRYRINDNKLSFSLLGGLSGGFVVNNRVYLEKTGQKENLGSVEEIRKMILSSDLGIGIQYPISRKVKMMFEPGFRYYLQSVSKNHAINYKPYTFTLSTGLGIEF